MAPVAIPEVIQRRAWECAWSLANDWPDRISIDELRYCARCILIGPERIEWPEAGVLLRLYRIAVEVRV